MDVEAAGSVRDRLQPAQQAGRTSFSGPLQGDSGRRRRVLPGVLPLHPPQSQPCGPCPARGEMRRRGPEPDAEAIRQAVSQVFAGHSACQQRRIWMFALNCLTWLKSGQIAALADKTPGAVTHCVQSLGKRLQTDPRFAGHFAELVKVFQKRSALGTKRPSPVEIVPG